MYGGDSSHLPLKLNASGVIPPIFASSLLLMPTTLASFGAAGGQGPEWLTLIATYLGHGPPLYLALYVSMIVFFPFFSTDVVFNPEETADTLRTHGGFVRGIRPGQNTSDNLAYVIPRTPVVGALH